MQVRRDQQSLSRRAGSRRCGEGKTFYAQDGKIGAVDAEAENGVVCVKFKSGRQLSAKSVTLSIGVTWQNRGMSPTSMKEVIPLQKASVPPEKL